MDTLLKTAVLLARETTGLERLAIVEEKGSRIYHSYGISLEGLIVDQHKLSYEKPDGWNEAFGRVIERHDHWLACETDIWEHTESQSKIIGTGWCVRTPIPMRSQRSLYLFNDAAISKVPLNPELQELVAIYCIQLGAVVDRISTDQALRQSEERYRDLIDNINDTIFSLDARGTITFVNQRVKEVFGYSPRDLIGHNFLDFAHPDDAQRISQNFQNTLNGASLKGEVYRFYDNSGAVRWVQPSSRVIRTHNGTSVRTVLTDISNQYNQEIQAQRLAAGLEQSSDLIVITDPQGNIEYVNTAFEHITGYSREEIIGKNPNILKSGHHTDQYYKEMWGEIRSGQVWRGHFINRRKNGTLYEEDVVISPIYDESGALRSYVASGRDVTHEMAIEQQLRQSQKMEAVGKLAGGIAHDFNNLLMVIINSAQFVEDVLPPHSEALEDIQELMSAANRAADLTRQMLAFSRQQPMRLKTESINKVILHTLEMLKRLIGEDIAIEFQPAINLPNIRVDAGQIEQVITNLAVNARDAMPDGGRLLMQTEARHLDKEYGAELVRPEDFQTGTYICLTISDSGVGIPQHIAEHIFEPFFTTKDVGQGTGLGLSTVFGIITQHHGFIRVYSEPDYGTTFQIFLPESIDQNQVKAAADPAQDAPLPTGHETILLVEDEFGVRRIAASLLRQQGYTLLEAENSDEAWAALEQVATPPDLLITDMVMPGVNGPDLAKAIREKYPDIKHLFISGYPAKHLQFKNLLMYHEPFLPKPFSRATLAHAVRSALES